jgi:fused signal recognition particle receptor
MGIFSKLFDGLKKTKDAISSKISYLFNGELDDEFYEELEFALISSDMGVMAVEEIIEELKTIAKKKHIKQAEELKQELRNVMAEMLKDDSEDMQYPGLITFVGVNGVGKTTAIGKIANMYKKEGKDVLMVAGDTFRAAAADQLTEWSKRVGVRIVKYSEGTDPGAVVFDGIASAVAKGNDVVLVDTAGRLQNKSNLMDELKKISKIIDSKWTGDTKNYLVIDATTGQNALSQVEIFNEAIGIDGIVLTKLDGTSKGGIVFAIKKEYNIPIKYVGVGEGVEDLQPFDPEDFANNII